MNSIIEGKKAIFTFLLLQAIGWGGFFVLRGFGINYIDKFYISIAYFVAINCIIWFLYEEELFEHFYLDSLKKIIPVFFILYFAALYLGISMGGNPEMFANNPGVYFLSGDRRYFLTKSFEIGFQEMTFFVVSTLLYEKLKSVKKVILVLSVIIPLLHLPNFFHISLPFAIYLQACSFLAAILFPYLILKFKNGLALSYMAHLLFYICTIKVFI